MKRCEICDSTFECKGLRGCWCTSVKVTRARAIEIAARTDGCVCPSCLSGGGKK